MRRPKRHYRKMTPAKANLIRELYFMGRIKQVQLARGFGISQGNVSRIVSGGAWAQ